MDPWLPDHRLPRKVPAAGLRSSAHSARTEAALADPQPVAAERLPDRSADGREQHVHHSRVQRRRQRPRRRLQHDHGIVHMSRGWMVQRRRLGPDGVRRVNDVAARGAGDPERHSCPTWRQPELDNRRAEHCACGIVRWTTSLQRRRHHRYLRVAELRRWPLDERRAAVEHLHGHPLGRASLIFWVSVSHATSAVASGSGKPDPRLDARSAGTSSSFTTTRRKPRRRRPRRSSLARVH